MMSLIISRGSLCSRSSSVGSSLGYVGTGITYAYTLFADLRLTIRARERGRGKLYLKVYTQGRPKRLYAFLPPYAYWPIRLLEIETLIRLFTLIRPYAQWPHTPIRPYAYWQPKPLSRWRYNILIPHPTTEWLTRGAAFSLDRPLYTSERLLYPSPKPLSGWSYNTIPSTIRSLLGGGGLPQADSSDVVSGC